MKRYDFPQRSEEWQRARLGIPTSSEFHKIVTPKTCKLSEQSAGYMHCLLAAWMLGAPLPEIETDWMQRGAELEDQAVRAYEFETGLTTETVGFCTSDDGYIGCSPDRLVLMDEHIAGCLEIKCPAANTHVGYLLSRSLDDKYAPQTQGQLLITGRAWVDTVSYYPGLPTVIIRTPRREEYIKTLKTALEAFVETMLKAREKLTQLYGPFPIAKPAQHPDTCPVCGGSGGGVDPHSRCGTCEGTGTLSGLGISDEDVDRIVAAAFPKGAA